ncbi:MAG: ATP-dependent 6-phosphofructokinase [Proteobacteria bacterium]|nr:MAG: ATP-dependent 6-phosphofructokinase [Pseudomonadota bacterium]
MKIGLSTGGGDCPGLNSVIRAIVRYASATLGHEVIGIEDSFNGLLERPYKTRELTLKDVSGILNRGGTILGTSNSGNPFKMKEGQDPRSCTKSQKVVEAYHELGLDCIIVIGGDGTQRIANQFIGLGLNIIGIPKTIDNDLHQADFTTGFETAVEVASEAIIRLQSTAESHDRIMVLEVMGRHAGHIALHSGIASGAHVILVPEIPFDYKAIVSKIEERKGLGHHYSVVAVAEGAFEIGGEKVYQTRPSGKKNLGGVGQAVADKLSELTGSETRVTVLGHIQRGGEPCPRDRILGTLYGVKAVDLAIRKEYSQVVVMRGHKLQTVPYESIAQGYRQLESGDMYLDAAEAIGVCLGR